MDVGSRPSPRVRAFVAWTLRHGRALWIVAVLLAVPAAWRTGMLYAHLRTSIEELLPRDAPSVRAIEELRTRTPGLSYLGVIVDVGKRENMPAAERLLGDLEAKVRAYPPELVQRVRTGTGEERAFLEKYAPLYVDVEDLKAIRARIEARRDYEVGKQMGSLLDDGEPPPPLDFSDLEKKYKSRVGAGDRFPNGRFSNADLGVTLLLIEAGTTAEGKTQPGALFARVTADLATLGGPDRYAPGMRVGFTGNIATTVEETSALMEDLSLSSVLVIVAVAVVIVLYYRWARSLVIILVPLLLAAAYAFAVASLPPFGVAALNSNTAFLGSIIVGNGINFGLILTARYVEARRAGESVEESIALGVAGARRGTLTAALAAGAAYASLGLTDFRGFRQFGMIGGIGMVICWATAFVLTPSLIAWLDRSAETAPRRGVGQGAFMNPVARAIAARPMVIAVAAALLTIAAAAKVRTWSDAEIEYDLSRLRRADTWVKGEGYWGPKMNALLGAYLTPIAILTDDPAEARAVATRLREEAKKPPLDELVASIRTIDDVLPRDQAAKIQEIEAIKATITKRMRTLVPEDKRAALDRLLGAEKLTPITAKDLPSTFATGLRERDGTVGRSVLVYPRPSKALWLGPKITALSGALRTTAREALPGKRPARVAGGLTLSADIFASLRRDGPIATGAAFVGVMIVVIALFGRRATTLYSLGALIVGVLWLAALAMALHVKLNFTNFIAYPITFGIGVDYSVNVLSRHSQDGGDDIAAAVRSTGGAVGLCSLTTIIGYSSLLVAQNRALFYFGLLAVLGEVTCLLAAVVAMPALLAWQKARRTPRLDASLDG